MDGTNTLGDSAVVQKPIMCEIPAGDVLQSIEDAKTGPDAFECVRHYDRVKEHYNHAREKHPYFCDWVEPQGVTSEKEKAKIETTLAVIRGIIKEGTEKHTLGWDDLLNCEVWEVFEALAYGNKAQSVEKLYGCIAVCLRTIDVIEGRQNLGKPEEKGERE